MPSNGVIAKIVLHDLDLFFEDEIIIIIIIIIIYYYYANLYSAHRWNFKPVTAEYDTSYYCH